VRLRQLGQAAAEVWNGSTGRRQGKGQATGRPLATATLGTSLEPPCGEFVLPQSANIRPLAWPGWGSRSPLAGSPCSCSEAALACCGPWRSCFSCGSLSNRFWKRPDPSATAMPCSTWSAAAVMAVRSGSGARFPITTATSMSCCRPMATASA